MSIRRAATERRVALAATAAMIALTATPSAALAAPSLRGVVDVVAAIGFRHGANAGSGLLVSSAGEVLTNNHVIRGATKVTVTDPETGRSYAATVVGYDVLTDVAVLQLRGASHLSTVVLGDSAAARPGDSVTAIGNTAGRGGLPQSTRGTILALDRSLRVVDDHGEVEQLHGLIQASARIRPGDSGGPLLNRKGQVIGMDTATASRTPASNDAGQASFAIPIDAVLAVAQRIESGRRSANVHVGPTPFIGVDVQLPLPGAAGAGASQRGALVVRVVASSPAQRAGLGKGDLITTLDGHAIGSFNAIAGVVVGLAPGTTIGVGWLTPSGAHHRARLQLASGPPQ